MRRIILIILASLVFCNIGFAEIREMENEYLNVDRYYRAVTTFCIDGHKFVVAQSGYNGGISMIQFYERHGEFSLPAKC